MKNPSSEKSKNILAQLRDFISDFMNIHQDTDTEATIKSIKANVSFRGHTSWILMCAVIIASLGLNADSMSVLIGAMLISPLMGPILGISLSLATNDVDLLRRAVKNFVIMVLISVGSAYIFFTFFPLRDTSSELLAHTSPDIRDVLIAFFGGLALVIARAKRGTIASVVFGVAIATSLMPPLCTVGFFLAVGNLKLAFGALYLFLINTIFIGLATFIVLRFIKVPMVVYANSSKRRKISRIAYFLALLTMIPAGYTFYQVWKISKFKNSANKFIEKSIETYEFGAGRFVKDFSKIEYNEGNSYIELVFFGDLSISDEVKKLWENQKNQYSSLKNTKLFILNSNGEKDENQYVKELYDTNKRQLISSQNKVKLLQDEVGKLVKYSNEATKFQQISKEIGVNYENVASVSFANELVSNFKTIDTVPVFRIRWKNTVSGTAKKSEMEKLTNWLSVRLENKKIIVKEE